MQTSNFVPKVRYLEVTANSVGQRLDNFLIKTLKGAPRSLIYRIVRGGEVRVNKGRQQVSYKLQLNDAIRIPPIRLGEAKPLPSKVTFKPDILFEDDYFLIINKPANIAVHGGSGINLGVIEQLRLSREEKELELGHRLDRETSGCLVLTKKSVALRAFHKLAQSNDIIKQYHALVIDRLEAPLIVEKALKKNILNSGERIVKVDATGTMAITKFAPLKLFQKHTLVQATLVTGKTHQIRVHLQSISHPIVNDEKYNFRSNEQIAIPGFKRMFLHAHSISFMHPIAHEKITVVAPYDKALNHALKMLEATHSL